MEKDYTTGGSMDDVVLNETLGADQNDGFADGSPQAIHPEGKPVVPERGSPEHAGLGELCERHLNVHSAPKYSIAEAEREIERRTDGAADEWQSSAEMIPIATLRTDGGTQSRACVDQETVEEYA